jgi:hypothetical protein
MDASEHVVGLADAIDALRDELADAMDRAGVQDRGVRFRVEPIELTLQAVITRKASGKIGWGALGIGGARDTATTQTLRIRLDPLREHPDGTLDDDFAIAERHRGKQRFGPAPEPESTSPLRP